MLETGGVVPVALGFRSHSGWAALVAVAGGPGPPRAVLRERIELADGPEARQPYHAAEALELPQAERLIRRCRDSAERLARRSLSRALGQLRELGCRARLAGILEAAGRLPKDLEGVLASHAFIHTADGEHFRDALARAGRGEGLEVVRVPERELGERAAAELRRSPDELQEQVAAWGRSLGSPWAADQKQAALLAWLLLVRPPGSGTT